MPEQQRRQPAQESPPGTHAGLPRDRAVGEAAIPPSAMRTSRHVDARSLLAVQRLAGNRAATRYLDRGRDRNDDPDPGATDSAGTHEVDTAETSTASEPGTGGSTGAPPAPPPAAEAPPTGGDEGPVVDGDGASLHDTDLPNDHGGAVDPEAEASDVSGPSAGVTDDTRDEGSEADPQGDASELRETGALAAAGSLPGVLSGLLDVFVALPWDDGSSGPEGVEVPGPSTGETTAATRPDGGATTAPPAEATTDAAPAARSGAATEPTGEAPGMDQQLSDEEPAQERPDTATSEETARHSIASHEDAVDALRSPPPARPRTSPLPPDPGVRRWRGGFGEAARGLDEPSTDDITESPGALRDQADTVDTQRREERPDHHEAAREVLPEQPEAEEPIPEPEPDPVPQATALIDAQASVRLPDQSLPTPVRSPDVDDDTYRVHVEGLLPGERPPPPPAPETTEIEAVAGTAAGESRSDPQMSQAREEAAQPPEVEERRSSPEEPVTLRDEGPPSDQAGLPEGMEADMTEVLANLLLGIDDVAQRFADAAERAAFPRGVLATVAPEIADEAVDTVASELRDEVEGIREAAGIETDALSARVRDLEAAAEQAGEQADTDLREADREAHDQVDQRTDEEQEEVRGAAEANEDHIAATQEAATGEADPAHIERKADRLISKLQGDAARVRANQRAAKEQRERDLDAALGTMRERYDQTADAQARRIRDAFESAAPPGGEDADPATQRETQRQAGLVAAGPTIRWARRNVAAVGDQVAELKRGLTRVAREHAESLTHDETTAVEMVRTWRDERLDQERSWWDRLLDLFRDWGNRAVETNEAWEETRNRQSRDHAVADLQLLGEVRDALRERNQTRLNELQEGLDAAQRAVLQTFMSTGGNAVQAVKAGMLTRIGERRIPELTERFQRDAEDIEDWQTLDALGAAQTPGFNADTAAQDVFRAVDGPGTEEDRLFRALNGRTRIQLKAIRLRYADLYGRSMEEDIHDDLSDEELDRANRLMEGDRLGAEVAELRYAMTTWSGTDEDAIMRILRNKTPEEREELVRRYEEMYDVNLDEDLRGDLSGYDLDRAMALREGDVAGADAIAVDQAMNDTFDWGTDEGAINSVYSNIRSEVEAEARRTGMTTEEMEAEIRRRNAEIDQRYGERHGDDPQALNRAFGDELSDAELDLARAYRSGDATAIDAATIRVEERGLWDTDDDVILDALRHQRERAEMEARLDLEAQFETERRTSEWTPEEERRRRDQLQRDIRSEADQRAESSMDALEEMYDDRYSQWGPGGLQVVVAFSMGGQDQDEARDLIAQHGRLTPAQELRYSLEGAGTNEDRIRRVLRDPDDPNRLRSPQEIQQIREEYRRLTGRSLDDDLADDLDGRDAFDILEQDMLGEPQTPEERLARLQARERFERGGPPTAEDLLLAAAVPAYGLYQLGSGSGIGQYLAQDEGQALDITMGDAEEALRHYRELEAEHGADDPRTQEALAAFNRRVGGANAAIEHHQAAVDSAADTMATVAGVAAGIAVTVATAGTAAPAVIAAGAAVAATAATVTVKAAVMGRAYGGESLATDLAIGGVDVAAAVATAGVGNVLLRTSSLSRLAGGGVMRRVGTNTITEGVEGALGGIPSGMAGAMLDDNTWRSSDPLGRIATAAGQAGATGFLMSGGMHVGGESVGAVRSRGGDGGGGAPTESAVPAEGRVPVDLQQPPEPGQALPGVDTGGAPAGQTPPPVPDVDPPPAARGDSAMTDAAIDAGQPIPMEAPGPPRGADGGGSRGAPDDTLVDVPALGDDTQVDLPAFDDTTQAGVGTGRDVGEVTRVDLEVPQAVRDAHAESIPWATAEEIDGMVMMSPNAYSHADALQMYDASIRENPHLEAAIYRNVETGEYIIIQGNEGSVAPHGEGHPTEGSTAAWREILDRGSSRGRWELESHSHPVQDAGGVTDRIMVPSGGGGDLGVVIHESLAAGGQPRTSRIHGLMADGSYANTDFGFDPSHPQPFWVDRPIGTRRPGEPVRRDVQRFDSLEHYNEFLESVGFPPSAIPPEYANGGWRNYLPPPGAGPSGAVSSPVAGTAPRASSDGSASAPEGSYVTDEAGGGRRVPRPPEPEVIHRPAPRPPVDSSASPPSAEVQLQQIRDVAQEVEDAFAAGRTREGRPLPEGNLRPAELEEAIARMRGEVDAFSMPTDPAARQQALDALQERVSLVSDQLRSYHRNFEVDVEGEVFPSSRRRGPRAARDRAAARRVGQRAAADLPDALARWRAGVDPGGMTPHGQRGPEAAPLLDILHVSDMTATARGEVLSPLDRRLVPGVGLESQYLGPGAIRGLPTDPPELAAMLADLVHGYERAHLVGPGFGGELFQGMMLAPRDLNQTAQNRGVEDFIRWMARRGPVRVTAAAEGRQLAIPLADGSFETVEILGRVTYTIEGPQGPIRIALGVSDPPNGTWRVEINEIPAGLPGHGHLASGDKSFGPASGVGAAADVAGTSDES